MPRLLSAGTDIHKNVFTRPRPEADESPDGLNPSELHFRRHRCLGALGECAAGPWPGALTMIFLGAHLKADNLSWHLMCEDLNPWTTNTWYARLLAATSRLSLRLRSASSRRLLDQRWRWYMT